VLVGAIVVLWVTRTDWLFESLTYNLSWERASDWAQVIVALLAVVAFLWDVAIRKRQFKLEWNLATTEMRRAASQLNIRAERNLANVDQVLDRNNMERDWRITLRVISNELDDGEPVKNFMQWDTDSRFRKLITEARNAMARLYGLEHYSWINPKDDLPDEADINDERLREAMSAVRNLWTAVKTKWTQLSEPKALWDTDRLTALAVRGTRPRFAGPRRR
jgi:hypothetical protein